MKSLPKCLGDVVHQIMVDTDTPRSLTVDLLVRYGEFGQLVNLKVDPSHYVDGTSYFKDVLATDLLRKCESLTVKGIDKARVAWDGFLAAEQKCKQVNDRLDKYVHNGPFEDPQDVRIADFLGRVKSFVSSILGAVPKDLDFRFGPGSTFGSSGWYTTIPHKMSSQPTVTLPALDLRPLWDESIWARALCSELPNQSAPDVVRGNRFTTVPKDSTKNRGICIEPSLNIWYQLGVGAHVRRKLKRFGIDLDEGQHLHKRTARDASITANLSTIDLSSASDSISRNLVRILLPGEWTDVLEALRSPATRKDNRWYHQQKFSSMGNGYTFELETLIFFGLAVECCVVCGLPPLPGENVMVYGDDIIVPTEVADTLLACLRFLGFTPNGRKTFVRSAFRESCGGDYFLGQAVRPHYLKEFPNEPSDWISLANGLSRVVSDHFGLDCDTAFLYRSWLRCLGNIPSNIRACRGPSGLGDVVIHDQPERWSTRAKPGFPYRREIRAWRPLPSSIPLERWSPGFQLAAAIYGVPSSGVIPRANGREITAGYKMDWLDLHDSSGPYPPFIRRLVRRLGADRT